MMNLEQMLRAAGPDAKLSNDNSPRAHRIVMRSAKAYCGELYDLYASRSNTFYAAFPSQNDFVRRYWPHFTATARATLARMLSSNIPKGLKKEIHDGLMKDQSLVRTRAHVPQVDITN